MWKTRKKIGKTDPLAAALADWRSVDEVADPQERLAPGARAVLLARTRETAAPDPLPPLARLFVPAARIAYAAVVPALVLGLAVGWFSGRSGPVGQDSGVLLVQGSKINGEVVFRITNGGRPHRVYRSSSPKAGAERELLTTTTDRFSDRLEGTTGVVYYVID